MGGIGEQFAHPKDDRNRIDRYGLAEQSGVRLTISKLNSFNPGEVRIGKVDRNRRWDLKIDE
jgi:hypothetical protein